MEDEIPFDVPDGWSWCRLRNIGDYKKGPFGSALTKSIFVPKTENTIKVYEQKNAIQHNHLLGNYYISKEYFEKEMQSFEVLPGDIIVSCAGTIGETYILPNNIEKGIINQALMRMRLTSLLHISYFLIYFEHILKEEAAKSGKGTAIKNIPPFDVFKNFLLPLPPLSEQKLIVEEIEKIFAQIDLLEQNKTDLQTAIKQAKSKILDLAIHGKLVPQDPNDEPASVLLEKIRAEKEEKIAKGELKRDKNDSFIYKSTTDNCHYEKFADETEEEIEVPFELPNGWCWGKLKDSGIVTDTGYPFNASNFTTDPKNRKQIIRIRDILRGYSETYSDEQCPTSYIVNKGDILVGMDGDFNVGKWKTEVALLNQRVCRIKKEYNAIILDYVFYLLPIPLLEINKNTSSVTVKHLSNKQIENLIFPIPPLNEQTRIVSKIEELFSILDNISLNLV